MATALINDLTGTWSLNDLNSDVFDDAVLTIFTNSRIVITGSNQTALIMTGNFSSSSQYEWLISSMAITSYGTTVFSISDISLTYAQIMTYSATQLEQIMFAGSDSIVSNSTVGALWETYSGNDTIELGTGDDIVFGGSGTDTFVIRASIDNASYSFYENEVRITSKFGSDSLYDVEVVKFLDGSILVQHGSEGNDSLTGNSPTGTFGFDMIHGHGGNDTISGGTEFDFLVGGDGHDRIMGRGGNDGLFGGSGNDHILGGGGEDSLYGGTGDDTLFGGTGNDVLDGFSENDRLFGNSGSDSLSGGKGDDYLEGGDNRDHLQGNAGHDTLMGGKGNDRLVGGGGKDQLMGGSGNDRLVGGNHNDALTGGSGNDMLLGGKGRDSLLGHHGNDVLTGGAGRDVFVFHKNHGNDTITDFELGIDHIQIGRGASRLGQLDFEQQGNDVLVSFANVEILIEDVSITSIQDAGNFLF
ncbi:MAG: glycerophosphodiester phosphodiesterase [Rhodobacteraceae bacterium]|nr:MAG: glycerophosphodiester phosphodiesterase [Paracoccaceae bacterium]